MKKRQRNRGKWELDPDPVWEERDSCIMPKPFFLEKVFQAIALAKYGNKNHWLNVAYEMGYVGKYTDPKTRKTYYEPNRFDYDGKFIRKSLGVINGHPLISDNLSATVNTYNLVWDQLIEGLLTNEKNENDH